MKMSTAILYTIHLVNFLIKKMYRTASTSEKKNIPTMIPPCVEKTEANPAMLKFVLLSVYTVL